MDIDVNDVLAAFAAENAKQTQRAIIAETQLAAMQKVVLNQHEAITALEAKAADQPSADAEVPAEPAPGRRRGSSPKAE